MDRALRLVITAKVRVPFLAKSECFQVLFQGCSFYCKDYVHFGKKALHLRVNVFSKKVLIGACFLRLQLETGPPAISTWSPKPREGLAVCR